MASLLSRQKLGSIKSSKHGYVAGQKRQGRWVLGSVQVAREIIVDR